MSASNSIIFRIFSTMYGRRLAQLSKVCVRRMFLVVTLVLSTANGSTDKVWAMGSLDAEIFYFWEVVIASYWWSSKSDYVDARSIIFAAGDRGQGLLPGEVEPIGLVRTYESAEPRNPANVTCDDFRSVRFSDPGQPKSSVSSFRSDHQKSAIYIVGNGLLYGFGLPSSVEMWVAAMLPPGAAPLFNSNNIGLSKSVMSRTFVQQLGYDPQGVSAMPADRLILENIVKCTDFEIFHVRYK